MADVSTAQTFVRFSLDVYRADDVGGACLHLQDRFDVDVNLVLFASYVGAVRGEVLTAQRLAAAHGRVDPWHRDVVRALRAVRRGLKTGPAPAPNQSTAELRRKVQQVEIEAELIELAELGQLIVDTEAPQATGTALERAAAAIEEVIAAQSGESMDERAHGAVATIAAAAARLS
ncbi:hypothetical protein BH11ACT7_BH11ACT7_11410 [soil metagenome]